MKEIKPKWPMLSMISRIFFDPLIAWWMAIILSSVNHLEWLGDFNYWNWMAIVVLIQALGWTDSRGYLIKKYKTFKELMQEK